jgi:hypothetical protein
MKKAFIILFLWLSVTSYIFPQGCNIYTVTRQTGITFNSIISSGTSVPSWRAGSNTDNNRSEPVSIGFYFNYLGNLYNTVSISTNGFLDFSSSSAQGYGSYPYGYDNSYFTVPAPDGTLLALAPFYEDLMVPWGGSLNDAIKFQTTGSSGNKVFIVEWNNLTFPSAYAERVTFQVRLYESDSDIEFIYGSMSAASASLSYTCGINNATMSVPPTAAQLLTQQTPNSATFGYTPQNSLSVVPTSSSKIIFNGCILPSAAGPITGSGAVCDPSTGLTYSVASITGATGYSWTLPSGFTITSGNNTNIITTSVNGGMTGTISVAGTNSCGSGTASTLPVTVNLRPTPTITGPSTACANTTGHTYTTQSGMSNYQWTVSSGWTIASGQGTSFITVTWNTQGSQTVEVNYTTAAGCAALIPASFPVTVNPNPTPSISGPISACAGSSGNIYSTQTGMSNYQWTVSSGGTITAGGSSTSSSVTVTWNSPGAQSVSVNYTNPNGCSSPIPGTKNVTVNPLPVPTVTGPNSACVNSSGNVYSTQGGMTNYQWSVSTGGNITGGYGTNTITITWISTGTKTVSVIYTNNNGCTAIVPGVDTVQVNPRPVPTITGPSSVCAGTSGHVYTTETGMSNYQWTVSTGGTITSGSGTNSITVSWGISGSRTVTINYANSYGCNALTATSYAVTVFSPPNPSLTGPDSLCRNTSGNIYTTESGMSSYQWTVSSGGTITAGGTSVSNTVTITWTISGNQSVGVNYTNANGCSATSPTTLNVLVYPLPVPTITGPASVCVNSTGNTYTTEAGMTNYSWTVSTGGTITSGTGTNSIQVTWTASGSKTVSVTYTNANGCNAAAPTVYGVTVNPIPVPTITGPVNACQGTSNSVYTTQAGMSNYNWTVSYGGTILSGSGTYSITVAWNQTGSQSVSVSYTSAAGCPSANPGTLSVTVHPLPAPTITGNTSPCLNSGNNTYTTQANMTNYLWSVSSGGMIITGGSTNQIQVSWVGSGSQSVSVNYTNANGCTAPAPATLPVNVLISPGPAGNITGPDSLCGGTGGWIYTTDPIANATSYLWIFPPGATITQGGGTNTVTVTFNDFASSGNVTVSGINSCGTGALSQPFPIHVTQKPPKPEITHDFDILISNIPEGNQWYWNGIPIFGAVYQTHQATANGIYWDVVTVNGCPSDTSNHIDMVITSVTEDRNDQIQLYPNPNEGTFILRLLIDKPEWPVYITISSPFGSVILQKILTEGTEYSFSLENHAPGVYLFRICRGERCRTEKIILLDH